MDYRNWYAVSVETNKERICKQNLLARKAQLHDTFITGVEYLQEKELVVEKSGKRRIKNKTLLPGYLLVQVSKETVEDINGDMTKVFPPDTFNLILATPGIKQFINCKRNRPHPMSAKEAKTMFDRCDEAFLEVKQNIMVDYVPGDILEVIAGPFKGYSCEVQSVQGDKILGQLDMFGRTVPAEFTTEQVYKNK